MFHQVLLNFYDYISSKILFFLIFVLYNGFGSNLNLSEETRIRYLENNLKFIFCVNFLYSKSNQREREREREY